MLERNTFLLLIEDNSGDARLIQMMLEEATSQHIHTAGFEWRLAESLSAALSSLERERADAVLLDPSLPDSHGLDTIQRFCQAAPDLPVVVLTGSSDEELAIQAMQAGAQDYLVKGQVDPALLTRTILYSIERKRAHESLRQNEKLLERRNQELALLNHASQVFNSTLELDQVLLRVLEMLVPQISAASSFWLVDPETHELVCRQAHGIHSKGISGWRLAPGKGLVGWVAQHNQALVTTDAQADPRYYKGVEQKTGLTARSILTAPLNSKGKVIGVLQLLNTEADTFYPTQIQMVEALAAIAAVAVENARLYAQVEQLAIKDELTGLYNRRGFNLLAEQMITQASRSGDNLLLAFIDVDSLKQINDSLGHLVGDQALIEVAQQLKHTFRASDILARIGGDEFAVLASVEDPGEGALPIRRLRANLQEDIHPPEQVGPPSISIGFAVCHPATACTLEDLLSQADASMYSEKMAKKSKKSNKVSHNE